MKVVTINDTAKHSLYKKSTFADVDKVNNKSKQIDNQMLLFTGTTGSGKTVAANSTALELKNHGYTVIYVTEKKGKSLDNGFFTFPIEQENHKSLLQKMEITEMTKEEQHGLVKIYHPFTFNVPKKTSLPPINFFTFPLKTLSEQGMNAILAGTDDNTTTQLCQRMISKLTNTQNLWDFLWETTSKMHEDRQTFNYDPESMFVPVKISGDATTVSTIRDRFSIFRNHYNLQPINHSKNLNFLDLINDNKHIHLFSLQWIPEERSRYFYYIEILQKIVDALDSGKAKKPVCIVLEEIKVLLPKKIPTTYQAELSKILVNMLSTVRVKGRGVFVIATTQNYYGTDESFRSSASETLLFKLSPDDTQRLIKYQNFKQVDIDRLNSLTTGQYYWWRELVSDVGRKMYVFPPPHAIAEENQDDFYQRYKKYYPEEMQNYSHLIDEMIKERSLIEDGMLQKLKKQEGKVKAKTQEKKTEKDQRKELTATKRAATKQAKDDKIKAKEQQGRRAYELKLQMHDWKRISREIGVDVRTVQLYAEKYARKVADPTFYQICGWNIPESVQTQFDNTKKEKEHNQ